MKMNRILAIAEKDTKEYFRNMSLFMTMLLPVFMALLFTNLDTGSEMTELPIEIIFIIIGMTLSSVLYNGMATMMAEENEKDTLRGLNQSPASLADIIIGKSTVVYMMTLVALIAALAICQALTIFSLTSILGILLLSIFFLALGIFVGLIVKSVATTAVYTMPILFLFGFTSYIEFLVTDPNHISRKIANVFPLYQAYFIHTEQKVVQSFIILLIWVGGSLMLVGWAFKKQAADE